MTARTSRRPATEGEAGAGRHTPRQQYPTPAVMVGCLAYTRERGWHFGTVDLADLRRCDLEAADARRPKGPRELKPCGSHAAFNRHKARGEQPCSRCAAAERRYQAERGRVRRQRKAAA